MLVVGTVGESLYAISKKYYAHVNGGILPVYFYYYLGVLAAPISAALVAGYFNLIIASRGWDSALSLIYIYILNSAKMASLQPNATD